MRVLFLCGSLEPERNGVGDYTRLLATACVERGHECMLLSLCDTEAARENPTAGIDLHRFVGALTDSTARAEVLAVAREWKADWISLQFVPFAYHKRGLTGRLNGFLDELRDEGRPLLQIMFHELWLGLDPRLSLKLKLLGHLQHRTISQGLQRWRPSVVHTSNPLYVDALDDEGIPAGLLPLFGNIPVAEPAPDAISALLPEPEDDERRIVFPFSQSAQWSSSQVADRLFALADRAGVRLHLIQLGFNRGLDTHWPLLEKAAGESGHRCTILGPRDEATLSQVLHASHLGVSPAHAQIAGKSGAAVSMIEHGLPVLCSGSAHRPGLETGDSSGLYSLWDDEDAAVSLLKDPPRFSAGPRLSRVADAFLASLSEAQTDG